MGQKHNWTKIRQEYLDSETVTFVELAKRMKVPLGTLRNRGAMEKWNEMRDEILRKSVEIQAEARKRELIKEREESFKRGLRRAKLLGERGEMAIESAHKLYPKEAISAIKTGFDMEQKVLGLDQKGDTNVQVNVQNNNNLNLADLESRWYNANSSGGKVNG